MNGVHDLGGADGFGTVEVEPHEPVFHARWEGRVFAAAAAITGQRLANVHSFRHAIERMAPVHYLESPYYEHWLTAVATLLVERGLLTREELETRAGGAFPLSRAVRAGAGDPGEAQPPRFAVGSAVVVRNMHPHGHTRCPRYVRGKRGTVVRVDGTHALPDVAAHSDARRAERTYSVRFDARELWGDTGGDAAVVHVDLWESYLDLP